MSIRINLPGGVTIETDTLVEAVAVAKALAPGVLETVHPGPVLLEKTPRTRLLVTNADLKILEDWGLGEEDVRRAMSREDWEELAKALGRTVDGTEATVRRYSWGVYESSGSDPAARVIVHADRDLSRSKPAVP